MIVCLRTVVVPAGWRGRYLAWIDAGRAIRKQHAILAAHDPDPPITNHDTEEPS
jgi:hypothetical protein